MEIAETFLSVFSIILYSLLFDGVVQTILDSYFQKAIKNSHWNVGNTRTRVEIPLLAR